MFQNRGQGPNTEDQFCEKKIEVSNKFALAKKTCRKSILQFEL